MDPIEQENALLEQRIAEIEARLSTPRAPQQPNIRAGAQTAVGGLINLGDILTANQLQKVVAAVPAVAKDIYGYATGKPAQDYYAEELAKVQALKDLYAQQREASGLAGVEEALSFMAPVPGGKAQKLTELAPALKAAGSGLSSYIGSEAAQEIAPESKYAGLIGALAAPTAVTGAKGAVKAIGPTIAEAGKGLQRTSLGIRASDYTKAAKNQIIENVSGEYETTLKNAADRLLENKQLGSSTNPEVLYSNLRDAKETTEAAIQTTLKNVDETKKTGIIPRLDKTLEWIQKKAPADQVGFYKEKVNNFLKELKEQGQGSLVYLNQQKKAIGENWKQSPETDPTFWRRFYSDIKETIEKNAPEVKDLNKQKRDLLIVEPVIERTKRAAEKPFTAQDLKRALLYTTGGGGLPGATYLLGGNPVLGAALAGGLGLLGTKKGQQVTGRTLTKLGRGGEQLIVDFPATISTAGLRGLRDALQPEVLPTPQLTIEDENALLEERIKAIEASLK